MYTHIFAQIELEKYMVPRHPQKSFRKPLWPSELDQLMLGPEETQLQPHLRGGHLEVQSFLPGPMGDFQGAYSVHTLINNIESI